jgi:hypothetical protein
VVKVERQREIACVLRSSQRRSQSCQEAMLVALERTRRQVRARTAVEKRAMALRSSSTEPDTAAMLAENVRYLKQTHLAASTTTRSCF